LLYSTKRNPPHQGQQCHEVSDKLCRLFVVAVTVLHLCGMLEATQRPFAVYFSKDLLLQTE